MSIYDREKVSMSTGNPVFTESWESQSGGPYLAQWGFGDYVESHMRGQSIPNFHKRKKAGELLPHTYFTKTEITKLSVTPGSYHATDGADPSRYIKLKQGNPKVIVPVIAHLPDDSRSGAEIQRAAANIYSNGFDALTFLIESKKTATMFGDFSKRLKGLATNRGRLRSAKELSRLWLEGRYGWRQLAFDAKSLHNAVTEFNSGRRIWSERSGYSYSESKTETIASGVGHVDWRHKRTTTTVHSIRGAVSTLVELDRFVSNPINTAWELLPLSFVLDWALTVGNSIQSAALLTRSSALTASAGTRSVTTYDGWSEQECTGTWVFVDSDPGRWSGVVEKETRVPTTLPIAPQISGRMVRPDQILDLSTIAHVRGKLRG
jgi:hypothetical protein